LFPNPSCLRLRALSEQFLKTVAVSTKEECDQLSKLLKNHVKSVSIVGHPSASGILDTLISAKTHGFEMPEDIGDEVFDRLEKLVVKEWFHGAANSTEVTRLSSGRLMGDIRDRMVRRKDGQDEEGEEKMKMAVYSGHDTTIAPLLVLMNSFDDK
ncbi:histidine phosphatase superfamily, partial [Sporodiniella umbellata]